MTETYTLYDSRLSGNAWKVRMLLRYLDRPFRRVTLDLAAGEARTPQFRPTNPVGKVPVLELPDGRRLAESGAILNWLARGTSYLPEDPFLQAQVLQWMFFEQAEVRRHLGGPRNAFSIAKNAAGREAEIAEWHRVGNQMLAVMDAHLATRTFFVGERFTIADIAHYPYTSMAHLGRFEMDHYPNILAWLARVEAEPGYTPLLDE